MILELVAFLMTVQVIAYCGRTEGSTSGVKLLLKSLVGTSTEGREGSLVDETKLSVKLSAVRALSF